MPDKDEVFFRTGHYHHRSTGYHGLPGSSHRAEIRKKVQLLCPLEITEGLLRKGDAAICGEEAMEEKLKTARSLWQTHSIVRSVRKQPFFMRCRILRFP